MPEKHKTTIKTIHMSDTIESRIKSIIVEQLNVDEATVTADATFSETFGADSLDTVELVMAFEEEFSMEVPEEEAANFKTVGDVIAYVKAIKGE